jgi:hypothetical protein
MKKLGLVAALLAAGVIVASGLFAQDIKFDGVVNSGLGVVTSTEDGAPDTFIAAFATDAGRYAYRLRLNASYTNEAANAGAYLRLQATGGRNTISIPAAYGWFSAFNKILTVKGGLVDDGTWMTSGAFVIPDNGEGLGALAKISPVSGLDLGVGAYLVAMGNENTNNVLTLEGSSLYAGTDSGQYARALDEAIYVINAAYTAPNLLKFIASYRTKGGYYTTPGVSGGTSYGVATSRLQTSVSVLAVPGLKAVLEVVLDNLQDFGGVDTTDLDAWDRPVTNPAGSSGKIDIVETFEYRLLDNKLTVGLWAVEYLSQAENTDFSFYVNPWVSYAIGSIVPRLDLGYGSGVYSNFNNTTLEWHRTNLSTAYNTDVSVISIRPSVKFNIDPKTSIEIGDLFNIDTNKITQYSGDDSRMSNVFYLDFKWTF